MKKCLHVLLATAIATAALPVCAANLIDVFERAKQSDPQILKADADRLGARESKPLALAKLLPQLGLSAGISKNKTDSLQPFVPLTAPVDYSSDVTEKSYSLQLNQSIFHWDQWAALKRADAQVAQAEANYLAQEQDLIVRVAQGYFGVLSAKDQVDSAQAAVAAFEQELEQTEKRFEVGLIPITDVKEARAQRDQSVADVIDAKRQLATAIEQLRAITGAEFDSLAAPTDDMPLKTPDPASEDKWVSVAMEQNLGVIAARMGVDIARQDVNAAEAGHLPSLDLVASYGKKTDDTTYTAASGSLDQNTFQKPKSIGLQLTFPIFSGGATQASVRQKVYAKRSAQESLELATRQTERDVRDNYLGVLSDISRVKALKQALESSQVALQATEAGFDVGTRTTVDVLLSRNKFFQAQTTYLQSRYKYLLSLIQLEQAAGQLNRADLEEINGWLK